jgi:protein phosphatase
VFFKKDKANRELIDWKPIGLRDDVVENTLSIGSAIFVGKRSSQQDSIQVSYVNPNMPPNSPIIAILSDGMGGMADGSRASKLCTNGIFNDFNSNGNILDYPKFLENEIVRYDNEIFNFKDAQGNQIHSGATLICCIVENNNLYWGTVGDSHLYIIRNGEIFQVNRDHNYMYELNQKVQSGLITEAQAQADPHKDSLISFMGMGGVKMMDINSTPFKLEKGDFVVMCSDGLYRTLSDQIIKEIVRIYKGNIQNACEKLISAVIERDNPSQDNTSVIILKYL